ncbi:hypothetical protein FRC15_010729 [Serendipita sp. 397]|nr:hypothetical protein FRC15_010729 [Serendipita sp. 397]
MTTLTSTLQSFGITSPWTFFPPPDFEWACSLLCPSSSAARLAQLARLLLPATSLCT